MPVDWTNESLDAACTIVHGGGFARGKKKLRLEMKKALDAALDAQGLVALSDDSNELIVKILTECLDASSEKEDPAVDNSN